MSYRAHPIWSVLQSVLAVAITAGGIAACTDSEISGSMAELPDTIEDVPGDLIVDVDPDTVPDIKVDGDVPPTGCTSDIQCAGIPVDGPCQEAYCGANGQCQIRTRPDCCNSDVDCPATGDPCLVNTCLEPGGSCRVVDECSPPCTTDQQCATGGPDCALSAVCADQQCVYDTGTCCLSATQCSDGQGCTVDFCNDGECSFNTVSAGNCCPVPPVILTSFSGVPNYATDTSAADVNWTNQKTPLTPSPSSAMWLSAGNGGYGSSSGAPYVATARFELGQIPAGNSVDIRFQTFVDVRAQPTVDRFRVFLAWSTGAQQTLYSKDDGPLGEWTTVAGQGDASPVDASVTLNFEFETVDGATGTGVGVMVDDLVVQIGCSVDPVCTNNSQCVSDDPCQLGVCVSGECVFSPVDNCCQSDDQCPLPPFGACVTAACEANQCVYEDIPGCCTTTGDCPQPGTVCAVNECINSTCQLIAIPNCCTSTADCPQVDPDTACAGEYQCVNAQCVQAPPPPGCCDTDSQCNDGDPCTADSCTNNVCVSVDIPNCGCVGPNCCEPIVFSQSFDGSGADWNLVGTDSLARWQIWNGGPIATSPPGVLYYGNPDQLNFIGVNQNGNSGTATSPPITLPSNALDIALTFQLFLDTEPTTAFDQFFVYALGEGGTQTVLYVKPETGFPMGSFLPIEIQLGFLAGQTIQLVFSFDTIDSIANEGVGVIVDDILIEAECIGCTSNQQCNDNDPCTQDVCSDGNCFNTPLDIPACQGCDPALCNDNDPCTTDSCNDAGQCVYEVNTNPCDDGNACTTQDQCLLGQCFGQPVLCDDGVTCTTDTCVDGSCQFQPIAGCCSGDFDCLSPEPCIQGSCNQATATCEFETIEPCCTSANDCIDGNTCTQDVCNFPICDNIPIPGCCTSNADCATNDPCEIGVCDVQTGLCSTIPSPNCCPAGESCDDGDACTTGDTCDASGSCVGAPIPGCCTSNDDCDDFNLCTTDSCQGGQCSHVVDPFCCDSDDDCDDSNPCTLDSCFTFAGFGVCQYQPLPGDVCCSSDNDCPAGPCEIASCEQFQCVIEVDPACQCGGPLGCDDGNPCTFDTCVDGLCQNILLPDCCSSDQDCVDGDVCTKEFCDIATGQCIVEVDPTCCLDDAFCDDGNPCTDDVCGDNGQCLFPPVVCPDDGDLCTLETCNAQFGCISVPNPSCCIDGAQCDDGNPCTFDTCGANGECQFQAIPGCCLSDGECNDNNACTADLCGPGNQCINLPQPNCCTINADCDDGNPCTANACVGGTCESTPLPDCCQQDSDCDDGNSCSLDSCVVSSGGSQCVYTASNTDGCCNAPSDCSVGACQIATCEAFTCGSLPLPGCCTSDIDCDDGQPCTADSCLPGGLCLNQQIPECCTSDAACDDGEQCTLDTCDDGVCTNTPFTFNECVTDAECGPIPVCKDAACVCGKCEFAEPLLCDDGDDCTIDECVPGIGCVSTPDPQCCQTNAECNDGNDCTVDSCNAGVCTNEQIPDCCVFDEDCHDNNPCTTNLCVNGSCEFDLNLECCQTDPECDDGNPCTNDTCITLLQFGICQYNPVPGPTCCASDGDCTPNQCETASCDNFECVYESDPSCCTSNADCNDNDSCTDDICAGGTCLNPSNGSCCTSNADCNDGNACTTDVCGANGNCSNTAIPNCCSNNNDCDDSNDCTIDVCDIPTGSCSNTPGPDCCTSNADCSDGDDCTEDLCDVDSGACNNPTIPNCCEPKSATNGFGNPAAIAGWTITPPQAAGTVTWWLSGNRFVSPNLSLYMGNPATGNFNNADQTVVNSATTQVFGVPDTPFALAEFRIWADTEQSFYDELTISVVTAVGAQVVWSKNEQLQPAQYQSWALARINLTPWTGQSIQLRFDFNSIDGIANDGEGIYIDNLTIEGLCEDPGFCNSAAECNDGNPCTVDTCLGNVCNNAPQPDCCVGDADCDDAYACTVDQCVANDCQNTVIAGCCVFNSDCNDGVACTTDSCDTASNSCVFTPTPDCCSGDDECDDGDVCTADACVGGSCQYTPSNDPNCCSEDVWFLADFNENTTENFVILGDGSSVGWTTTTERWWSPPFAFYYGDPVLGSYNAGGQTFGTAFSPIVSIPASAQGPTLSFQVYLDIESVDFRDQFEVSLLVGGNQFPFWDKSQLDVSQYNQWVTVELPLPGATAGQDVRVVLEFDSVDGFANDGEGIYIDDIRLTNTCPDP